jgi:hypothetical protein
VNPTPGDAATAIGAMAGTAELTEVRTGGTCWLVNATILLEGGGAGQVTNVRMYPDRAVAERALDAMDAFATVLFFPAEAADEEEGA